MINKELYNLAIKADEVAENRGACSSCFCWLTRGIIESSFSLKKTFFNWKNKNNVHTSCSSVLFYLEDLGIIKISSGTTTRTEGVSCKNLKYTIIKKNIQGNKI